MAIQTSIEIKGVLGGAEKNFIFVSNVGIEAIFRGKTPRELFLQNVSNPGCFDILEKDLKVNIHVEKQCSFGVVGFQALDVDTGYIKEAAEKACRLEMKSERQLFVESLDAFRSYLSQKHLKK